MKIVINKCYGGFGLSSKAMQAYAAKKGITLYPEEKGSYTIYWTVPKDERIDNKHAEQTLYDRDIDRDDPILVEVVEELGKEASDHLADLECVEVPDGVSWQIEDYDGNEWISEKHQTWG